MRRTFVCTALAAVILGSLPSSIEARVGDKTWTQCVWQQASASADAWLAMPVPAWASSATDANVLLGHKLIALCDSTALNPLKPNRMPNWKSISASLRRARPKMVVSSAPAPTTRVSLCTSQVSEDAQPVPFLYEIVEVDGGRDVVAFQQYVGDINGTIMKLPQDLRMVPKADKAVTRTCREIGPTGELLSA